MAKRDELLRLYDLADRKGFDVTQSTMRDHVRLIDGDGNLVKNQNGGFAFSYAGRFLEALPDQKSNRPSVSGARPVLGRFIQQLLLRQLVPSRQMMPPSREIVHPL